MKWFPIHIIIKDSSFMIFYLVIMKYNLTNETYLPETTSSFPGAAEVTWTNIIGTSLLLHIFPMALSLLLYYPIVLLIRKLFKQGNMLSLITRGFFLTLTTPIIYWAVSHWKPQIYVLQTAEVISWSLCFISSIVTYCLLNYSEINSGKFEALTVREEEE